MVKGSAQKIKPQGDYPPSLSAIMWEWLLRPEWELTRRFAVSRAFSFQTVTGRMFAGPNVARALCQTSCLPIPVGSCSSGLTVRSSACLNQACLPSKRPPLKPTPIPVIPSRPEEVDA